ncbi:MAG: hypothetical protein O7G85_11620, partial [Planctomycetota bacterium]|nr:hypothetical protein [Planctomycetota bacterium]
MSRTNLSWRFGRRGKPARPSPLTIAHLERRFRTEADDVRETPSPGLGRRTLAILEEYERGGPITSAPFPRTKISMASLSLAASLVLAIFIGQVLVTQEPLEEPRSIAKGLTIPSSNSLQADAWASVRSFQSRTGLNFDSNSLADPLMMEMKAMWSDVSSAANAILTSMPSKFISKTNPDELT